MSSDFGIAVTICVHIPPTHEYAEHDPPVALQNKQSLIVTLIVSVAFAQLPYRLLNTPYVRLYTPSEQFVMMAVTLHPPTPENDNIPGKSPGLNTVHVLTFILPIVRSIVEPV